MIFKKFFFISFILIFLPGFIHSQYVQRNYSLNHPIKTGSENASSKPKKFIAGSDSLKIVAILVQFVQDDDGRTTGNGKFDLDSTKYYNPSTGRDTVFDAPPYDSSYFADHLEFLKNYYSKSSKGKLNISYDLFGKVINLPHNMEYYSPQVNESNTKLCNLFNDSWASADSFINFSNYDISKTAFVIFHAGVGRDVDLKSLFGFDPTPYDIPSVYLGLKNLKDCFGNSYGGYQTNEGFYITNSSIIPSTELREIPTIAGTIFVQLGINGIMCANIGSYLGLPDLFDTRTGRSAIGRFGLMDGESIFSYAGVFPPEPSAWEKIYLGWVDPVVISSGTSNNIRIPTSSKNFYRDSTIYKVQMSSKEYFLIENRNRDPENDGQKIYSHNRSFNDTSVFTKDVPEGFYWSNTIQKTYLLNGNITDVQNLDWSAPGLILNQDNYKGGILIWHIDETVIDSKIASNTVNNSPEHKGVDLEEAKGAQDIGVLFNFISFSYIGSGTEVDYWFNGYHEVPTSIYKNAFTSVTAPNSLSYSLANNNISFTDFSTIDTLMTLKVSIGGMQLQPIANFPKFIGTDTGGNSQAIAFDYSGSQSEEIFANSNNNVYGFDSDGNSIDPNIPSGKILTGFGKYIPSTNATINHKYIIALSDTGIAFKNTLGVNSFYWSNAKSSCPQLTIDPLDFTYVGRNDGIILKYISDSLIGRIDSAQNSINQFSLTSADTFTYITNPDKYLVVGNLLSNGSTDKLTVNSNNEFFINGNKLSINYDISGLKGSPVLADVNSDGRQEIIFTAANKVFALNANGVLLDNFPVNFNKEISSGISVTDVNNDNVYDLIFVASNGDMYAYGIDGKVVGGFPVKTGPNTTSTPALININDTLGIAIAAGDGYLYVYKTNTAFNNNKILWKNYLKDKYLSNNNFISGNSPSNISEKLPSDKVYNWPNPVYDNQTFIRYYLNGNATSVNIKILDLSGELVTSLKGTSYSKADNEVKWDVSNVQSGIYYGVVEAEIDGSKETKIIKIAVVK